MHVLVLLCVNHFIDERLKRQQQANVVIVMCLQGLVYNNSHYYQLGCFWSPRDVLKCQWRVIFNRREPALYIVVYSAHKEVMFWPHAGLFQTFCCVQCCE